MPNLPLVTAAVEKFGITAQVTPNLLLMTSSWGRNHSVFARPENPAKLCIAKTKENVYFMKRRVNKKHALVGADLILADPRDQLSALHKKRLLHEFVAQSNLL